MKNLINTLIIILVATVAFANTEPQEVQNSNKSVRLSLDYYKMMDGDSYLSISAKTRENRKYIAVQDLIVNIYQNHNDLETILGTIQTDVDGNGQLILSPDILKLPNDSIRLMKFRAKIQNQSGYKDNNKSLEIYDAILKTEITTIDSTSTIVARLYRVSMEPIVNAEIKVYVERSFAPLILGDEFYKTDKDGTIVVPIKSDIPGDEDGNIQILVKLEDDDSYGNLSAKISALGVPITPDLSFYTNRTMWSTRDKTPLWLLIIPNMIIFGIWITIFYLIYQLKVISKT